MPTIEQKKHYAEVAEFLQFRLYNKHVDDGANTKEPGLREAIKLVKEELIGEEDAE